MKEKNKHQDNQVSLNESLNENPTIQWVANNGSNILFALVLIVIAGILFYRYNSQSTIGTTNEYIKADKLISTLERSPVPDPDSLDRLMEIMDKHPELHQKYDGNLTQILIKEGETEKAQEIASQMISRTTQSNLPLYADFAKTTLLINQEKYEDALKQAQSLDMKMKKEVELGADRKFGDTLYAYNLLRIGMIQQELGLKDQELKTWQRWNQYLDSKEDIEGIDPKGFDIVLRQFTSGNLSLKNYIEERNKELVAG